MFYLAELIRIDVVSSTVRLLYSCMMSLDLTGSYI